MVVAAATVEKSEVAVEDDDYAVGCSVVAGGERAFAAAAMERDSAAAYAEKRRCLAEAAGEAADFEG